MAIDSWPIIVLPTAILSPVRYQAENAAVKNPVQHAYVYD
jgi:hypothetical protein